MTADVTIIFIDPANISTQLTGRVDGLQDLSITFNDELKKSFSSELEFYDDGYNILRTFLLDDPNSTINSVKVKIYDNCCNTLIIDGVIRATTIDWCEPICSIKASIIEDEEKTDCLKSTIIWDDTTPNSLGLTFLEREQKRLRYSVDLSPTGLLIILLVFYGIFNLILSFLNLFLGWLAALIVSATTQQGFQESYDEVQNAIDDLRDRMLIINWYHPTALVRDYIKNVCDKCNLQFQSSILNDASSPYYNTLLFAAQVRKGYKPSQSTGILIPQNLPVETLDTLMENHLKPLFNANYWVINGVLIFERKDFFDNPNNIWIDAEQLFNDGLIENNRICFSYLDKERPAFADFHYQQDFVDRMGNYANQRFDKIVEWNFPFSSTQTGSYEPNIISSPARFRGDEIERDTYDTINNTPFLSVLFPGFNFSDSIGQLLLGDHVCANYKFLIWDENSGLEDSRVLGFYPDSYILNTFVDFQIDEDTGNVIPYYVPPDKRFNYPFVFRENAANNLYYFHQIENPRYGGVKLYSFEFTFNFSCTEYINFDFTKTVRLFKNGQIVYGKVNDLKINFVNRTITVTGEV